MKKRLQILSLAACASLLVVSVALLPGCKKETSQTITTDSSKVTTGATDTTHTVAVAKDTAKTSGVTIAGKALEGQKIFYNTALGRRSDSNQRQSHPRRTHAGRRYQSHLDLERHVQSCRSEEVCVWRFALRGSL
jgi:hypothetical protein